jgi:carbon-monoxide dehydrogenase large subunit
MAQFGIGQPVPRFEDPRLVTGTGQFVDDINLPDMLHGVVVRSPHAHARITAIDVAAARAAPGVKLVLAGQDYLARGFGTQKPIMAWKRGDGTPSKPFAQPLLVSDQVRFLGDNVAFVVADSRAQAHDAAELIEVDYDPLDAVATAADALAPSAPAVWQDCPDNQAFVHRLGDKAAVEAAMKNAAHVIENEVVISRVAVNTIEPRGAIGAFDPADGRYTLYVSAQIPHQIRTTLARALFKQPEANFRVIARDVGGGFGMKGECYPEYALCLWASEILSRPVKWIAQRSEGILTDYAARDQTAKSRLALDRDLKFLGFDVEITANLGAYFNSERNAGPLVRNLGGLAGTYTTPAVHVEVEAAYTNTTSLGPYRGAGRPEATYIIESMIDKAAGMLDIDPTELRRRNMIPADAMPFKTGLVFTYDCGEFGENLDAALQMADYDGFAARRAQAAKRGRLSGLGISSSVEQAAQIGYEHAEIRFDPSGGVTVLAGTKDHGQGHETAYKQILSDRLGIEPGEVRFIDGDTDLVTAGIGTFGSRSVTLGGTALTIAADKLIEKGHAIAAHVLDAEQSEITFGDGKFAVAGSNKFIDISDVARTAYRFNALPEGLEPGFFATGTFEPEAPTFPNGCHVCELEIDPETGAVEIVRYCVIDDVGRIVNPLLLKGQIHGGVAQGIGQGLLEQLVVEPASGQVLTGSFMDYAMPRADDLVLFEVKGNEVPTKTNPLGVKGAGEAGTVGALAAIMSAVNNALEPLGCDYVAMPATPEKIWRAIQAAKARV